MITLIAIRHLEIDGHVIAHGTELKPGLLAQPTINRRSGMPDTVLREHE